ncbi:MAG: hypothetical protein H8D45_20860 [Bacteroidetes bacterium]|nr:hypothetical protein [Bacteroidota bacterium]
MIKYYCDVCGQELTRNYVGNRLRSNYNNVSVEVMVAIGNVWNEGELCGTCLKDVIVNCINNEIVKQGEQDEVYK